MSTETMNEIVAVDESTAQSLPTQVNNFEIVDVQAAEEFMDNYQELVKALLDESDYQDGKKKKSAWRKLATAFNVSDDVIHHEETRDETGQIVFAKFFVKATLPNGRYSVGIGECSIFDKIRYTATRKFPADKDTPSNFELRGRFSNAEHDIPATAHTRAKSRAISDLIGAGEVSAEELGGSKPRSKPKPKTPKPLKGATSQLGHKSKAKEPKPPSKQKVNEAIEVEAKDVEIVSGDKPSMNIKELIDSNENIKLAVDELQAQNSSVNRDTIKAKLLDLMEMGKVLEADYVQAKALLE